MSITFTAGYIEVFSGDTFLSRHRQEREAVEAILALDLDGEYEIRTAPVKVIVKRRIIGPDAPALGPVLTISDTELTVTLDRPATGPTRIDRYELERYNGSAWVQIASGIDIFGAGMAYPDTGLAASTTYQYRARAVDTTERTSEYGYSGGTTSAGVVNQAPVWDGVVAISIEAGQSASIVPYCTDPEGAALVFSRTDVDPTGVTVSAAGVVAVDVAVAPDAGYTITVLASDGDLTSSKVIALTVTASTPASFETMHDLGFEDGTWPASSEMQTSGTATGRTIVTDGTARRGTKHAHFALTGPVAERMELASQRKRTTLFCTTATTPTPHEQWLGMSIRLVNYTGDTKETTLMQWHGNNAVNTDGSISVQTWPGPPICSIGISGSKWRFVMRNTVYVPSDPLRPAAGGDMNVVYDVSRAWASDNNHWTDFVYHVVWDWRAAGVGRFEAWMRGQSTSVEWLKVVDYTGGTGANNYTPTWRECLPYWKFGIYKGGGWGTNTSMTVDYDALKLIYGGGSFADVAPAGTPA